MAAGLGLSVSSKAWAQSASEPIMRGWHEAVIIVPDTAPWIETLSTVGGWEVVARGAPDTALNALWGLDGFARTEQVMMRNIGARKGYIRLVRVFGASQERIRPDDQAWDTGGVQALDLRVLDIDATRAALHARGWRAPSDPVQYKAYGVEDIQWVPVSPDGVRLSFVQRISPTLTGWSELKRWSRLTNAAITTIDIAAAQTFFAHDLGMPERGHTNTIGNGPNVMGLPWSFSSHTPIDIRGFFPGLQPDAAIELISMPQAQGRDFSAAAHPPNLGIAALRVAVPDARAAATRLAAMGLAPTPVVGMQIAPYGACRAFSVTGTDGVRLEFFEAKASSAF